jgi:FAD/FMN-containing dehydrogenase
MSEGGLTIDLSASMNSVTVDAATRRAKVGGGALMYDAVSAGAPHDLTVPYGHVSHTGVGGLTLGGGIGWLMRSDGLAIDSLRSARVVTAEGDVVTASELENPDLFWALRGGGGNFGIVTEFEFELTSHPSEILAGMVLHPLEDAPAAMRFSRDFMDQAPDELVCFETLMSVPPEDPFPPALQGKPALALAMAWSGDHERGEDVMRELRAHGDAALDLVGPMTNLALAQMLDPTAPHGMQNHSKSHWLAALPDDAIDEIVTRHAEVTSPMSVVINARMGGAVARVDREATAFAHRDAYRLVWVVGSWWEGDPDEHVAWTRGVFDALTPHSTGGVYVNALDADEGDERTRDSYGERNYARLVELKRRWDPENVFRLNQNVSPGG